MRIAIFGENAATNAIAQDLSNRHNIFTRHSIHASKKSHILSGCNQLRTMLDNKIDFVLPCTLYYQRQYQFRQILKEYNVPNLLPSKSAAMLEWSKITSKQLFQNLGIPTPNYKIVCKVELLQILEKIKVPLVLKFEKLYNAGLQTVILNDKSPINLKSLHKQIHKSIQNKFILEQYITGEEYSLHVIFGKRNWVILGNAKDYKKRFNNDLGLNTTGTGSIAGSIIYHPQVLEYVDKVHQYIIKNNIDYRGIAYFGIKVYNDIPYLLEINTRFGDPETQSILPTISSYYEESLYQAAVGDKISDIKYNNVQAVSIVLMRDSGDLDPAILNDIPANITISSPAHHTSTSHVLTCAANNYENARNELYKYLSTQQLIDHSYRTDIGH